MSTTLGWGSREQLAAALAEQVDLAERGARTTKIVEELIEIGYVLPEGEEPEDAGR